MTGINPRFLGLDERPILDLADLEHVDDLCVIFEGEHIDSDGAVSYIYTVGGILRGKIVGQVDHATRSVKGALLGGDCIVVHAKDRKEADAIASEGLSHTVELVAGQAQKRNPNVGVVIESAIRPKRS